MAIRISLERACKAPSVARRFVDCGSCGEVVRKRQEQLICRECGLSFHRTCSTMVREDFRRLKRGQCKRTGGCYNELVVAFFSTGGGIKDGGLGGWVCGCIQDEEAQPRLRQHVQEQAPVPVVPVLVRVEPVVPVPEPARVEPVVPEPARVVPDVPVEVREEQPVPASSSVTRRVVGGILSATGSLVTLPFLIGISAVTLPFRIGRSVGGYFLG